MRERSDGCLVLDPQYAIEFTPEVTIGISNHPEDDLLSCYLSGYEVVTIEAPRITPKERQTIKRTVNRLFGTEITEEGPEKIVIQCPLKASAFPPDKILRREYALSSSLFQEALEAFVKADATLASSVEERDEEVDRHYFLLVRLLRTLILNPRMSEKLNVSLIDCLDYRLISSLIENIADQAVELARLAGHFRTSRKSDRWAKSFTEVGEMIKLTYEAVVKSILSREERILLTANSKIEESRALLQKLEGSVMSSQSNPTYFTATSVLRRVFDYLNDMIDLVTPKRE
ncbi:MAG: PhoU domain-containing protein [Candidatus Bathyarchaeia archaeon]